MARRQNLREKFFMKEAETQEDEILALGGLTLLSEKRQGDIRSKSYIYSGYALSLVESDGLLMLHARSDLQDEVYSDVVTKFLIEQGYEQTTQDEMVRKFDGNVISGLRNRELQGVETR